MKNKFILILFLFSLFSFSQNRRQRILSIIDQEIDEVSRLSRQYQGQNPNILFRRSELYLEKGRLIKEIENDKYLSLSPQQRKSVSKSSYFNDSTNLFLKAKSEALELLRKFPKYEKAADVYYILGFNEKEFGQGGKALDYLVKAESMALNKSKSQVRIQNALAEIYYNKKDYPKAIQYYEKNINNTADRWWTKDAYNLAWSYFRMRKFDPAIDLMKKVEVFSKKGKYVDMTSSINKDIGLFYAESGRMEEGVVHYKKYNKDFTLELIQIASFLKESGKFAQAMTTLNEALRITKDTKNKAKIYLARMDLFDKYEKINYHLKDSISLYKLTKNYKLSKDQHDNFKFQVKKQIGKLQKKIGNKTYQSSKVVVNEKVNQVVKYLTLLKGLEPQTKNDNHFYMAETYYQAGSFDKAIENYIKGYSIAKKSRNKKTMDRSIDGMLQAIAQPKSKFPNREKYYHKVYTLYLSHDSRSAKAKEIYKKLYKLQYDKKNITEMKKILETFNKNFPNARTDSDKMVNSLVEIYSKQKRDGDLAMLMKDINSGKYLMSASGKQGLADVSQKIEVKKAETLLAKKDFKNAKQAYLKIFSSPGDKVAKANAAYNLMVLNYKDQKLQETYTWGTQALSLMKDKEFFKYRNTFLSVGKYLFERLQFKSSADISHRSFAKLCKSQDRTKKDFFNNAVTMYKASGNINKIKSLRNAARTCNIDRKSITNLDKELLDSYLSSNNIPELERSFRNLESNRELSAVLIYPAFKTYLYYQNQRNSSKQRIWQSKIEQLYRDAKSRRLKIPTEGLDAVSMFDVARLRDELNQVKKIRLTFPEDRFSSLLDQKIQKLDKLQQNVAGVQKMGANYGVAHSYPVLIEGYQSLIDEIERFQPPGKSPEYVKSFKETMGQVTTQLRQKVRNFKQLSSKAIKDNEILSTYKGKNSSSVYNVFEDMKFYDAERSGR